MRGGRAIHAGLLALACSAGTPPPSAAPASEPTKPTARSARAREARPPRAPPRLASAAARSWFSLRIAQVRWCKSPSRPSLRALGVGVEVENRSGAWLQVRDHDLELIGVNDRKIVRSLPPIGSECPSEGLGVLRPRETKRAWLYFAPSSESTRGLILTARLREPHGFEEASLRLALPEGRAPRAPLPAPPSSVPRPPPSAGVAAPVESPFYRVTVTATRVCNGGQPLPDGRRLLGVEVLLENFARVELEPSYTAVVKDASGAEYESVIVPQSGCEPKARVGAQVRPGDGYKSWLWAFPVPADAKQLTLAYRVRGSALDAWEELLIPIGDLPAAPEPLP